VLTCGVIRYHFLLSNEKRYNALDDDTAETFAGVLLEPEPDNLDDRYSFFWGLSENPPNINIELD
jgi:hypothetical protein